jgi:hypothetical protein
MFKLCDICTNIFGKYITNLHLAKKRAEGAFDEGLYLRVAQVGVHRRDRLAASEAITHQPHGIELVRVLCNVIVISCLTCLLRGCSQMT